MSVLVITADTSYHATSYDQPLRDICRDVVTLKYGPDMSACLWGPDGRSRRGEANRKILEVARQLKAEGRLGLVLCSAYDDLFAPETLRALRRLGACIVNHMVDMPAQWYRIWQTAPEYDCVAIAHRDHAQALKRRARDVFYLPMAASPGACEPRAATTPVPSLAFVGTWTPFRDALLAPLAIHFPQLGVYGNWQPHTLGARRQLDRLLHDVTRYLVPRLVEERMDFLRRITARYTGRSTVAHHTAGLSAGPVSFERMVEIFSNATINIGVTQSEGALGDPVALRWVRGRDFEVPMARGFYLVQRAPEHEEHYDLGSEIEVWDSFEDLAEKIEFYLNHPTEARAIAERGQRRALSDHTWAMRFRRLLEHTGFRSELTLTQ